MASNPVFDRIDKERARGYAGFDRQVAGPQGSYVGQEAMSQQALEQMYQQPPASPTQMGRVTMDDIIMKTIGLFAVVLAVGAVAWTLTSPDTSTGFMLMMGGIAGTLVLGLVIAFKKAISVPLIVTYAVFEGALVGAVSKFYNDYFGDGIVAQAILATLCVFGAMLFVYKTGILKVTDKFRRIMTFAIIGYMVFALVNFVFAMVTSTPFGIGGTGGLGIAISVFATGLAAFTLALDFDSIDRAISSGAPAKYSWLLAHGLIVTLVWLYLEMLRLLGRLRSE
jgi:uncharacterized YccA/Bax inhibitor family protein